MNLNTTAQIPSNNGVPLTFSPSISSSASEFIFIGRKESITADNITSILGIKNDDVASLTIIKSTLQPIEDSGKSTTYLPSTHKLTVVILPSSDKITRNNHPFSPHKISESVDSLHSSARKNQIQICILDEFIKEYVGCSAAAIARSLPLYHSKSFKKSNDNIAKENGVNVTYYRRAEPLDNDVLYKVAISVAEGVRLSAYLGDMPPAELNPDTYAAKCKSIADELVANSANVTYQEIKGDALKDGGYGGIYGVGMAAICEPRLVIMTYTPDGTENVEHVALCGKGVIYDTGGLSLKSRTGMVRIMIKLIKQHKLILLSCLLSLFASV
jgi:probable aminopeptidase NPEPL1